MIEVKVPDIGDFKDVDVIEVLVKPGDRVEEEASLIALESDKATMEIPSSHSGVVKELRVKVGDKVSQGSVILLLEGESSAASPPQFSPSTAAERSPAPSSTRAAGAAQAAAAYSGSADFSCDVVVLGAGPGGYSAAFRAADLGMNTVLVERYPTLGGVCLNVGCIPSKALLHIAAVMDEAKHLTEHGVAFGSPGIDLEALRSWKNKAVGKLTGGLAGMAKARKVTVLQGIGAFVGPNHLAVAAKDGRKVVAFRNAIVAAGSQSARLSFLPEDPRIVDSTGALELRLRPKRMLVIGGGIIGLEMGTVYSTLGARLDVVEMLDTLMAGTDRDLVRVWQGFNASRFDNVMLKTRATKVGALKEGLKVSFE
ncbi:MAG: FAD-dependent oxidoreductase, partial [Betaproteobacteria bacterium]